ncbi:MAG: magnesium chelatase subunit D [Bosea sp. (in: a-proteobacteria)]|uniref:magnesium chelatase subunit D n=1 Tax=Bosea sp. (in: a-proteobacteria) TaxID=1871050 RepID=UPI0027375588|nr:magnesium chelatase subunit D [Bosea sp. (in: a-proteobacteria)]MDP3600389.1 magnesium chelatase subunit D [Bosea sp. (in: a-proteobacteria)]
MTAPGASATEVPALTPWRIADIAAALLALDGASIGGVSLRAPAGPVRVAWLARLSALRGGAPCSRMPAGIGDARLLGGLDLTATLAMGRPVAERGLLAEADGGVLIVAMAERVEAATAAKLCSVLDAGAVTVERDGIALTIPTRFAIVALDEGIAADERPAAALTDRLALRLDLTALSHREIEPPVFDAESLAAARGRVAATIDDETIACLCTAALALGIGSTRTALQAVKVARLVAALAGREAVAPEDAALAAALVLAPRATQLPAPSEEAQESEPEPDSQPQSPPSESDEQAAAPPCDLDEMVLDAAKAAIPAGLLAQLLAAGGRTRARAAGRAGQLQKAARRGRVVGSKAGDLRGDARLDVVETLRAAAPWQRLRRSEAAMAGRNGLIVRREDFRIARYKQRSETATLFVVDASGSSALQRLAEAKGAVRLLLAECYVRRDEVALIAFRKAQAEIVLPPTRSLVAAERALAGLPGGGATPLATAIEAACALADAVRRKGRTPALVFMTDGRANIDRAGRQGRAQAQTDALAAARGLRGEGFNAILIDTSPQPQPQAADIAAAMGGLYLPLPQADAAGVGRAVGLALAAGR